MEEETICHHQIADRRAGSDRPGKAEVNDDGRVSLSEQHPDGGGRLYRPHSRFNEACLLIGNGEAEEVE